MWRDFFPHARIVGVDKNPATMIDGERRIETICDDASIPRPWRRSELRPVVVIDDGSHNAAEVTGTWKWLWPLLRAGGWYVIEDIGAQFCPEFDGDDVDGSAVTDLLNLTVNLTVRSIGVSEFHAYGEIAFIRKDDR